MYNREKDKTMKLDCPNKIVKIRDLKPGDYVIPAKAYVKEIQSLGPLVIVDFTDKTSTAPVNAFANVEIVRA